jgi:hypothetical protein
VKPNAVGLRFGEAAVVGTGQPRGQRLEAVSLDRLFDAEIIDELFWTALSRPPSEREQAAALALIEETGDRRAALEDLTWALLNAKELVFRN